MSLWDKLKDPKAYDPKVPYAPFGAGERYDRYHAEVLRCEEEFKADLFAHYGVTDHPKADLAYEIALEHAPTKGLAYHSIARFYGVLVALIKD